MARASGCPSPGAWWRCTAGSSTRTITPRAARSSASRSPRGRTERSMAHILIVDDEAGIREFIADVVEDDGHETVQAADALAAMHHLHARAFDLLITDL